MAVSLVGSGWFWVVLSIRPGVAWGGPVPRCQAWGGPGWPRTPLSGLGWPGLALYLMHLSCRYPRGRELGPGRSSGCSGDMETAQVAHESGFLMLMLKDLSCDLSRQKQSRPQALACHDLHEKPRDKSRTQRVRRAPATLVCAHRFIGESHQLTAVGAAVSGCREVGQVFR